MTPFIPTSWHLHPCVIPSAWVWARPSNLPVWKKCNERQLQDSITKPDFHLTHIPSLSLVLVCLLWWSQLLCFELPMERSAWQGTESDLQPTANIPQRTEAFNPKPSTTWMSLEVDPTLIETSENCNTFFCSLGEILELSTQLSHAQIPDLQKLWYNNWWWLKPLSFEVICYTAIDN